MKFFVTGVNGQLGHDVMNELAKRGYEAFGSDIQDCCNAELPYISLDITDEKAVDKAICEIKPDAVIHCAAWTAVDMAEDNENVSNVRAVNAGGTRNIATACKKIDCKMLYLSTDYVFDGQGTEPWKPDCKSFKLLNVYGQTKLEGELAVSELLKKFFIVRIAWVFGLNGKNFIKTMINVGKTHDEVRVVCDQIGTPTYGAGRGKRSVVYGTIGTGIGFVVYKDGTLLAAEGGHQLIQRHPKDDFNSICPYHTNCMEGLASGPAMEKRWGKQGAELENSEACELEDYYLGQGITNICMMYFPEVVILGGGVMHHEGLIEMVREEVTKNINGYIAVPEIVLPELGDNAGVIGAIELGRRHK